MKRRPKRYGKCFKCGNIMRRRVLEQVEYYEGHIHIGDYHHQLMCPTCEKKADELTEAIERGNYQKREHYKEDINGGKSKNGKKGHHK